MSKQPSSSKRSGATSAERRGGGSKSRRGASYAERKARKRAEAGETLELVSVLLLLLELITLSFIIDAFMNW